MIRAYIINLENNFTLSRKRWWKQFHPIPIQLIYDLKLLITLSVQLNWPGVGARRFFTDPSALEMSLYMIPFNQDIFLCLKWHFDSFALKLGRPLYKRCCSLLLLLCHLCMCDKQQAVIVEDAPSLQKFH